MISFLSLCYVFICLIYSFIDYLFSLANKYYLHVIYLPFNFEAIIVINVAINSTMITIIAIEIQLNYFD